MKSTIESKEQLKDYLLSTLDALDHGSYVTEESMCAYFLFNYGCRNWIEAKALFLELIPEKDENGWNYYNDKKFKEIEYFFNEKVENNSG